MANNRVINGIAVDDAMDNGKVPVFNSTTKVFDMTIVGGSGTVTSVAMSVPTGLTISGSPVTTTGTLAVALDTGYVIPLQSTIDGKQSTITFGTGVQTALGVNIGSAGAPVLFNGALGTPSSGTVTNLTGTASININGTVGATTPTTGAFTTLSTSSTATVGTRLGVGVAADASRILLVSGDVSGGVATINRTNASTNGVLGTAIIKGTSTGDMVDGFGVAFQFAIQDTAAVENIIGGISILRDGADTKSKMYFNVANTAVAAAFMQLTPTALSTVTNDVLALGTTALGWSDLHLATGALINWANGNAVITHSSGILTVSTGDLRVTTAGTNTASVVTVGGTQTLTGKTLTSPTLVTPALGTPASGVATNLTSIPAANLLIASQAAGDMLYASSTTAWTRLGKGTAAQVLTMNAGATAPEWQTPAGGGNPGWDFVSYTTASSASSITVSSLDLDTDLCYKVVVQFLGNSSGVFGVKFNNDTSTTMYAVRTGTTFGGSAINGSSSASGPITISNANRESFIFEGIVSKGGGASPVVMFGTLHGTGSTAGNTNNYTTQVGVEISSGFTGPLTSLVFNGATTTTLRVWVFKAATS